MLLANTRQFSGRVCEVPNDPVDHPGNLPTHRPLADRISRANLEIVEPLARVDMRTGNAGRAAMICCQPTWKNISR